MPHCIRLSANITLPYRWHKHYIKLSTPFSESSFKLIVDVSPDCGRMLPPLLLYNLRSSSPLSILHLSSLIFLCLQSTALIVQLQPFKLDLALPKAAEHALDSYGCFYSLFFQEIFNKGLFENFKFELFLPLRDEQNVSS